MKASGKLIIALAGNKCDLSNNRVVENADVSQYAESKKIIFMETSAKTAKNVKELFMTIGMSVRFIFVLLPSCFL